MAAVAGVPGLSALLAWPTNHLTDAAAQWETVAERSYALSHQVWREAVSVDWRGEAAEAVRVTTHADMRTTSAAADQLQAAARVARNASSELHAARSRLRYAVQVAQTAGYDVDEDLSVTDRISGGSTAQRAVRQGEAQALASDIRQRAAQLVALDQQIAGKISTALAGIGTSFPRHPTIGSPPKDSHVYSVDNHKEGVAPPRSGTVGTPPAAPAPQPAPPAPKPPVPRLGEGPMVGGGPSFGPQVVPPPHAHPHWLGETNIEEWEEGPAGSH